MKSYKLLIPAMAAATVLSAGAVFAQTTTSAGGVNVMVTPTTSSIVPGSGVTLGTLSITGDATGATLLSLPMTFGATGGGSVSNLTNCRFYDSGGAAVSGTVNPAAGLNSFALNSPLSVSASAGTTTLSVRCDVASGTPAGTAFQLAAGVPTFATGVRVNLDTAPSVPAGSTNVALANIILDTTRSSGAVTVSSIPISTTLGGGAMIGNLSNCHIRPAVSTSGSLSGVFILGGNQTFALTPATTLPAGAQTSLALACDVGTNTPVGGTFAMAITPSQIVTTNSATGAVITPTGTVTSGTTIVTAQGTSVGGGTDTTTPGIPSTGLGGSAMATLLILALSALVALGGAYTLRRA